MHRFQLGRLTSDVGGCGRVRLYTCLCVSLQRAYLNFCIHDMLFAITGKLAHDGTVAGERSLEAIECKYNKNDLLFISAL